MSKALRSSGLIAASRAGLPSRSKPGSAAHEISRLLRILVAALDLLLQRRDTLFEAFEIGEHQLGLDRLDVVERRDLAGDMGDVVILETAHDMGDGVAFADIGEKLIAEALAFRGAAHEPGDIDEGEPGRDDLFGTGDAGQHVKARIGHRHIADVRLDGAERIICRLRRRRLRQGVEKRRFADIRQTDDAAFETHECLFFEESRVF